MFGNRKKLEAALDRVNNLRQQILLRSDRIESKVKALGIASVCYAKDERIAVSKQLLSDILFELELLKEWAK